MLAQEARIRPWLLAHGFRTCKKLKKNNVRCLRGGRDRSSGLSLLNFKTSPLHAQHAVFLFFWKLVAQALLAGCAGGSDVAPRPSLYVKPGGAPWRSIVRVLRGAQKGMHVLSESFSDVHPYPAQRHPSASRDADRRVHRMAVSVSMVGVSLSTLHSRVCRLSLSSRSLGNHTPRAPRGHAHRRVRRGGDIRRRSYARLLCVCGTKRSPARTSAVRTCMRGKYGTCSLAAPTASASAPTGQVPAARRRQKNPTTHAQGQGRTHSRTLTRSAP